LQPVGALVGVAVCDGVAVGAFVGDAVGDAVGVAVGEAVGSFARIPKSLSDDLGDANKPMEASTPNTPAALFEAPVPFEKFKTGGIFMKKGL
jgi:hypothetical protein